jgi:hypothetical protein
MISGHIAVHSCASCPLLELISRFEGESAQVSGGRQSCARSKRQVNQR